MPTTLQAEAAKSPRRPAQSLPLVSALLCGCAALGPRPLSPSLGAEERLKASTQALGTARGWSGELEVAGGRVTARGTLDLDGPSAFRFQAEGTRPPDALQVELKLALGLENHLTSVGPQATAQQSPQRPGLLRAVSEVVMRQGGLGLVEALATGRPLEVPEEGKEPWARMVDVRDAGPAEVKGQPCRRLRFSLVERGAPRGEVTVCLSDETGLPLERRWGEGALEVVERWTWRQR